MAFFEIQNFKFGLDTRRSELTTQPGAMEKIENAHINQGGEIEKRKAFVDLGILPVGTFGLETTGVGVTTFGSAVAPVGLPAGVQYQQLKHPFVYNGGAYNAVVHAMTGVACSTSFGGFAWVAATFADGKTYVYNNGVPVPAFYNGTVLFTADGVGQTKQQIAQQLADYIGTVSGLHVGPVTANGTAFYFDMWSDAGFAYTLTTNVSTGAGSLQGVNISTFLQGVSAVAANTSFLITGGSLTGGGGIISITVGGVEILGVPVLFAGSDDNASFAAKIAGQLSTYASTVNLTTLSTNNTLTLSYDAALGETPNGTDVVITAVGDCCIDNTVFAFGQTVLPVTGFTCNHVTVNGVDLLGEVITAGVSLSQWVADIAVQIRRNKAVTGYTANANGTNLVVSRLVLNTAIAPPTNMAIDVTGAGCFIYDGSGANTITEPPLSLVLSPNPVVSDAQPIVSQTSNLTSITSSAVVKGGTSPYSFSWLQLTHNTTSDGGTMVFTTNGSPLLSNTASFSLTRGLIKGTTLSDNFRCTVTDKYGLTAYADVTVIFYK